MEMRKKHLNYLFLNISASGTENWKRCATSTDFAIQYNPNTEEYDYISYANPIDVLESYKPSIPQTQTAYIGDPIYDFVADIARRQLVGEDAVCDCLIVRQEMNAGGTAHLAEKFPVLITIDTDDFVAKTITYTINYHGDPVLGTATISSGTPTFTPDVVSV